MKRTGLMRKSPIKKRGPRTIKWENFRNEKSKRDRDEDGLLYCQDWKIGLPRCGVGHPSLDLHHTKGRDGNLLTDERYLVWLNRPCHNEAHYRNNGSTRSEAEDDTVRQMETEARSLKVPSVQGRFTITGKGAARAAIFGNFLCSNAPFVVRKEESGNV